MRIDVVTIFPPLLAGAFEHSIVKRARDRRIVDIHVHDLRDHTTDRHPHGGRLPLWRRRRHGHEA